MNPLPYPAATIRLGRRVYPLRLTFAACETIRQRTGSDWLAPDGITSTETAFLPEVLDALVTAGGGHLTRWRLRIWLALAGRSLRDQAGLWLTVALACRNDLPDPTPKEEREGEQPTPPSLLRLWAVGMRVLGCSAGDFWSRTPREFAELLAVQGDVEKRRDHRFGVVSATLANCNRGEDTDPFHPSDFFPGLAADLADDEADADRPAGAPPMRELEADALRGLKEMGS